MPTYEYQREDGSRFEKFQRITDDSLETCPTTGQSVRRIVTGGSGYQFSDGTTMGRVYGTKRHFWGGATEDEKNYTPPHKRERFTIGPSGSFHSS